MSIFTGFASAALQYGLTTVLVKPKRRLYNVTLPDSTQLEDVIAHAVIEESHIDDLEITDHPLQKGASITDHAFKRPAEVILKMAWSDSPVTQNDFLTLGLSAAATVSPAIRGAVNYAAIGIQASISGKGVNQAHEAYSRLLRLQSLQALFSIYTGKRVYQNMICKSLHVNTDSKSENSLYVQMVCRQLIIVSTSTFTLPKELQADPKATASVNNQGTKNVVPAKSFTP